MTEHYDIAPPETDSIVNDAAQEIIEKTRISYRQKFEQAIELYREKVGPFPKKVEDFIRQKGWLEPRFETFSGKDADEELKKIGFEIKGKVVGDDEILLVFQHPKPLTQYWNKRKKEETGFGFSESGKFKQEQLLNGMVIEWGYFYKKLRGIIWEEAKEIQNKYGFDLSIRRGNEVKDHTDDFYYVFLISEE